MYQYLHGRFDSVGGEFVSNCSRQVAGYILAWENIRHFEKPPPIPHDMSDEFHAQKFQVSASDWSFRGKILIQPIRSTSQIWVVMGQRY